MGEYKKKFRISLNVRKGLSKTEDFLNEGIINYYIGKLDGKG